MDRELELEIFRAGKHLSSTGVLGEYTESDVEEIASTYDPAVFRAPLLVTPQNDHQHPGDDRAVSSDPLLCHGIPSRLKHEGGRLVACFDRTSKAFKNWLDEKRIPGVSVALYPREDPRNPYPGKLALRHIAVVNHPAIKGLAMPNFSEEESLEEFPDYDLSIGETLTEFGESASVAQLMGGLRDYMIEAEGREKTEKFLPYALIQELAIAAATQPNYVYRWEFEAIERRVDSIEERLREPEEIYMSETTAPTGDNENDLDRQKAEFEEQIAATKRELAAAWQEVEQARAQLKRNQAQQFCEKAFSDEQLKPSNVEFSEGNAATIVDFVASLNDWQRPFFEEWTQRSPAKPTKAAPILFSEVTGGASDSPPILGLPESTNFDEASFALDRQIRAYMNANNVSYVTAAFALEKQR
jgi:hypothetical protein